MNTDNSNRKGSGIGRLHSQVEGLWHHGCKGIGVSRHALKQAGVNSQLVHSDSTRYAYLNAWHELARFAHAKYEIRNMYDLMDEMIDAWLEYERGRGLAPASLSQKAAAVRMLGYALTAFCRRHGFDRIFDFRRRLIR